MWYYIAVVCGAVIGYIACAILSMNKQQDIFNDGYRMGGDDLTYNGKIIARHDIKNEIMVEYDGGLSRYKKVKE